jgi:CubicO group peptidase (beta-lactamase class C family)
MTTDEAADRVLASAVEGGQVPAVVAMAGDADGASYAGAFGDAAVDSVFAIASMTKPVTSVAALQLVERGLVSLDEPGARHLPELASAQVLDGFDADGAPRLRSPKRPITLRHLLTHTAGFSYGNWSRDVLRFHAWADGRQVASPLVFDPGERWEYGINTDLVGDLVERVSGRTLEDYFREHVFDPLGMDDTGFGVGPAQRGRVVARWQHTATGSLEPIAVDPSPRPATGTGRGGGGLWSTGPDYLRFLRAMLHGGELDGARVLSTEMVAELARNQMGPVTVVPMRTTNPAVSNDFELFPGMVKKWGLAGLLTTEDAPGRRAAGSWSWAGLFNTYFWVDPTRRIAGLLLTQLLPFGDNAVLDLLDRFERAVYSTARG